ncbi:hypothetical protein [Streptomyces avermitilis]|uniref:hypothetical protein n=1 Tax=Streptomyces avermitilis TaxID=33903 RepID=UPI003809E234
MVIDGGQLLGDALPFRRGAGIGFWRGHRRSRRRGGEPPLRNLGVGFAGPPGFDQIGLGRSHPTCSVRDTYPVRDTCSVRDTYPVRDQEGRRWVLRRPPLAACRRRRAT